MLNKFLKSIKNILKNILITFFFQLENIALSHHITGLNCIHPYFVYIQQHISSPPQYNELISPFSQNIQ